MIIDVDDVRWAALMGQPSARVTRLPGAAEPADPAGAASAVDPRRPEPAEPDGRQVERRRRPERRREPMNRTGSRERRRGAVASLEYDPDPQSKPARPPSSPSQHGH
jgi:hypothetical protein